MADYIDLDHIAIGVRSIDEALAAAAKGGGGREVARFRETSWLGAQAAFASGIRLEALEPIEDPADDFLPRFLEHSGQGPHHMTFKVPDIRATLAALAELGIEPTKVNLGDPNWQEAFLHPRLGIGTVIQLAQPAGVWSAERELGPPPDDQLQTSFLGAELRSDADTADRVFGGLLQGSRTEVDGGVAYAWPGGGTLVVRPRGEERARVERFVFRVLSVPPGREHPTREAVLYEGPTMLVRLSAEEPWPAGVSTKLGWTSQAMHARVDLEDKESTRPF
jgi:catechol 2,3-dioxygenase-like lactoylglutathione lyase family enzyme